MDQATANIPDTAARSRWATIGWIVCSALLIGVLLGTWLRMGTERAGSGFTSAIVAGDRPLAPALPTQKLAGAKSPGLPAWYRTTGDTQLAVSNGRILVVNWWASWCGPCEDEAPQLQSIADRYEGTVVVVGLNAGAEDLESDARAFVREHELTFPIVRGSRVDKDAWGVGGYPETFIIGVDGRVSAHINGPIESEDLRQLLDHELAAKRSAT